MNSKKVISGNAAMSLATIATVTLATYIDVQVSLSQINSGDPATWPHMAPQIRYYFIPVFSGIVLLPSLFIHWVLQSISRRQFSRPVHWVMLGVSFGVVSFTLPVARAGLNIVVAFCLTAVLAFALVILVRWRYGSSPNKVV